jgi:hypothetical protein
MGSGLCIGQGHLGYSLDRWLCVDRPVMVKDTAVAVRRIFAQADICGDVERRESGSELLNSLNYWSLSIICWCSTLIL